ncbi:hypothetical protein K8Z61_02785 [Nocardioides sp. TRM66260-LWL]|uniref:hypothetical protein n=1 Tax=Nocardioides sp. TRM66260-LWL TaxID=2874478 RepID=UPI001CC6D722|nr:hypothetical protein [Nocardioides sp. TRM66260-LWL]MBZ5733412.1 hypothetical protein [Nocardioides sp. TRM66260-LWL]
MSLLGSRGPALAGAVLALSAVVAPLAATTAPATAAAAPLTKVTLKVSNCEGCSFAPTSAVEGASVFQTWSAEPRTVQDGTVTFTVPTWRTRGLVFAVDAPWAGRYGAQPLVTMHESGAKVGSAVTATQAATAKAGHVCFAGTASRSITLAVKVGRVTLKDERGRASVQPRAFAAVTQPYLGDSRRTDGGVVFTQETVFC